VTAPAVSPAASGGRWRRLPRRRIAAAAAVVLALVGVAVAFATGFGGGGSPTGAIDNGVATSLAAVQEGSLSAQTQASATLGYADASTVMAPAGTAPANVQQAQQSLASATAQLRSVRAALSSDQQALERAQATLAAARQQAATDCRGDSAAGGGSTGGSGSSSPPPSASQPSGSPGSSGGSSSSGTGAPSGTGSGSGTGSPGQGSGDGQGSTGGQSSSGGQSSTGSQGASGQASGSSGTADGSIPSDPSRSLASAAGSSASAAGASGGGSGSSGTAAGSAASACAAAAQAVSSDEQALASAQQKVTADQGQVSSATVTAAAAAAALKTAQTSATEYDASATFTMLPEAGDVIHRGAALYGVDGRPTLLLYGATPAWRAFRAGMTAGRDVAELNANLDALGYGHGFRGDSFSAATEQAVKALQAAHGLPPTGTLPLGSVVFKPGPVRVTSVTPTVGQGVQPGPVLDVTSTRHQVAIQLDPSQQSQVKVGDRVTVTLPDNSTTPAVISKVGKVATAPANSGSSGSSGGPTIEVDARLLHESAAGDLDQAPVQVAITTASVQQALIVPVSALLAQPGGGYAVETVDSAGTHHLVPVTVGLFDDADGLVQVSGSAVHAGQHVVVPST
jgi:hypothetical protein